MKPNTILILIVICLFTQSSYSQDFWELVSTPDTANPWTITFNDNGDIWSGSNGIYLSQDNGETWEFKGLFGKTIFSIAIDSMDNIFASTSSKIYKSTDQCTTWYQVNNTPGNTYPIIAGAQGLMLAGGGHITGYLLRSVDYGESWDTSFIFPGWYEHIKQIICTNSNVYYFSAYAPGGEGGGVYKSTDNGESLEFIGLFNSYGMDIALDPGDKLYAAVYGHYYTGIGGCYAYDDENSEWIFLTPILQAMGIVINSERKIFLGVSNAVGGPGGVYRSLDEGETWQWINSGLSANSVVKIFLSPDEYIYALTYSSHTLNRSINPTVSIKDENIIYPVIEVFPVPFNEKFYLKISSGFLNEDCILNIFDINGSLILKKELSNINNIQTISINGGMWKPGIYIYHLCFDNYSSGGKIIKTQKK